MQGRVAIPGIGFLCDEQVIPAPQATRRKSPIIQNAATAFSSCWLKGELNASRQPCFRVLFVNISRCNVMEAGEILLIEWGEIILSPARKCASWLVIAMILWYQNTAPTQFAAVQVVNGIQGGIERVDGSV